MDERNKFYNTTAYANKSILQQDLSFRISEAITAAGLLFKELQKGETVQEVVSENPQLTQAREELEKVRHVPALKKFVGGFLQQNAQPKQRVETRLKVNPQVYLYFMDKFYSVWVETKDQIGADKWQQVKFKEEDFKEVLNELFASGKKGQANVGISLEIFEKYITLLKYSGMMYFQSKSLKAGETWRDSV